MKFDLLDYASRQIRNRETFLLNYGKEFAHFDGLVNALYSIWSRLGQEADKEGRYHSGLLLFINILTRHAILGFQHIVSYQSFLAWLTFRPGLEAFLILGKIVEDPNNAKIWKERSTNKKAYIKAFSGKLMASKTFERGEEIRKVLNRLNDDFMHPNPDFTYRDISMKKQEASYFLEINFFDVSPVIHEAHLLAYLNLFNTIIYESENLINKLFENEGQKVKLQNKFESFAYKRAEKLSLKDPTAKKVMQKFGLWNFK